MNELLVCFTGFTYFTFIYDTVYSNKHVKDIIQSINTKFNTDLEIKDFKNNFDILFIHQDIDIKTKIILVCLMMMSVRFNNHHCDYKNIINCLKERNITKFGFVNCLIIKNKIKYKFMYEDVFGNIKSANIIKKII